tara:strand:- start:1499 stop:2854 length:1356 start_codon:yes stop_codon:yes gene_type:complete
MNKKLKNLLKLGILTFGFFLFLTNCQNEELTIEPKQNTNLGIPTIENTENNFNESNPSYISFFGSNNGTFQKGSSQSQIFNIDWQASHVSEFKEDVNFLCTPVYKNIEARTKTILASVLNEGKIKSFAYTMAYDGNSSNEQFSGLIFKHDIQGNFVSAYKYTDGTKIETYVLKTATTKKQTNIASRSSSGCTITLEDIIFDYANGGTGNILDCVSVGGGGGSGGSSGGSSGSSSGSDGWSNPNNDLINDNDGGGGGSGGSFGNPNNGGNGNNNSDGDQLNMDGVEPWWVEDVDFDETLVKEEVNENDYNPLIFANCQSFEYYKPPNSSLTAAAVDNMNEKFYSIEIKSDGSTRVNEVSVKYNRVYFTMPSWKRNGLAANETAEIVTAAKNATQAWYLLNPSSSKYSISDKWIQFMKIGMLSKNGQFSKVAPFYMRNGTEYQTSLLTSGDCD